MTSHDLGPPTSEFRAGWRTRAILTPLLLVVALPIIIIATNADEYAVVVAAALVVAAVLGLVHYQQTGVRVVTHAEGIVRDGRRGPRHMRWEDVESYTLQVIDPMVVGAAAGGVGGALGGLAVAAMRKKPLKPQGIVLKTRDGKKLSLGQDIADFERLVELVTHVVTERLSRSAIAAFDGGSSIGFGKKLSIQRDEGIVVNGLFGRRKVLPWAEVGSAGVERAAIVIRRRDKTTSWQRLPMVAVENPTLFASLVDRARGDDPPDSLPLAWSS